MSPQTGRGRIDTSGDCGVDESNRTTNDTTAQSDGFSSASSANEWSNQDAKLRRSLDSIPEAERDAVIEHVMALVAMSSARRDAFLALARIEK